MTKFKVGDRVKVEGKTGVVTRLGGSSEYPVFVQYDNIDECDIFTEDGKVSTIDDIPILELLEEENEQSLFQKGDIVEAFGLRGKVVFTYSKGHYSVKVKYDTGSFDDFTSHGLYANHHKEPSLKLVERPKKKIKKTVELYVNIYPNKDVLPSHKTARQAIDAASSGAIVKGVKVTGEYEIEE